MLPPFIWKIKEILKSNANHTHIFLIRLSNYRAVGLKSSQRSYLSLFHKLNPSSRHWILKLILKIDRLTDWIGFYVVSAIYILRWLPIKLKFWFPWRPAGDLIGLSVFFVPRKLLSLTQSIDYHPIRKTWYLYPLSAHTCTFAKKLFNNDPPRIFSVTLIICTKEKKISPNQEKHFSVLSLKF